MLLPWLHSTRHTFCLSYFLIRRDCAYFLLKIIKFKPNIFSRKSRREGGVFCLGNPVRRGCLVLQEIQVRAGELKNNPIH